MAYQDPPAPATAVGPVVTFHRTTRDGRRLRYELKVLQQPERARACGSGPKSSADRRPVDPPPVVMMKVFHHDTNEDITFGYNADFFLYASLHHAPDPQARSNPQTQTGPPVLTGLPVSSMILLDRPEEAGYFIFSDLSVRHEGRYSLTFALMEEVKEDKDKDADEAMSGTDEITGPDVGPSKRHFQYRIEVHTMPFDVYSAKKFPGLQESTLLSRTVAEQGCRVRIRRDVRMRRRGEKGGKGGKEIVAREDEYARRATADAAATADRDRSMSNDANGPYPRDDMQRRSSGVANGIQHRQPFPTSVPSPVGRQPPYGHMGSYPPPAPARSIPNSPSYPPPTYLTKTYASRPPYAPYAAAERSPPHQYGPPGPQHPRDSRESFSYRGMEPTRGQPLLAPKMQQPGLEQRRDTLPSIHDISNGMPEPRRPRDIMPRLPQPVKAETEHLTLPPLADSVYAIHEPSRNPTPMTTSLSSLSSSRKRSANEANLVPDDGYRLQNGRRQEEQPRDANYIMEPSPATDLGVPYTPVRPQPPSHWTMSLDQYNRASDNDIPVDFPGLHATVEQLARRD